MKKFAFLVHPRAGYRNDMRHRAALLGWIPDRVYRYALRNRPLAPFVWSDVTLTPEATEPEGYVIMLPYSSQQLLKQQKAMLPRIQEAIQLTTGAGVEIVGLGALTAPITNGGHLVADQSAVSITNGNAFKAYITWKKVAQLIQKINYRHPVVALVGATNCLGNLVSQLLVTHQPKADFVLIARNKLKLTQLAAELTAINARIKPIVAQTMDAVKQADIVVLMTHAADSPLRSEQLKPNALVLDATQPRVTVPALLRQRPDVTVIDGGLVAVPHLRLSRTIGLAAGLSYACLAETMLLAQANHEGHFSLGNPSLAQVEYISAIARRFSHLGFDLAPDYSFGKPLLSRTIVADALASLELGV